MLKNKLNINLFSFSDLFEEYEVSDEDIKYYNELIEGGDDEIAVAIFVDKYMVSPAYKYNEKVGQFLLETEKGELSREDQTRMFRNIAVMTFGLLSLFSGNFTKFIKEAMGPYVFTERGIESKKVQKAILDVTLSQFNDLTSKSLLGTQTDLLRNIRNVQKEMVVFNQATSNYTGARLDQATAVLYDRIKTKFPEYQKMKDGKLIASSPYGIKQKVRYYKLENYIEMSTRTTLLNIDRNAVEISVLGKEAERALKKGRVAVNVVRYSLIDNRILKTGIEREICKEVLRQKKYGNSLVALDSTTASKLGIPYIDDIRAEGAMGPYCRHGLLPVSVSTRKQLEKILKEKENV